MLGRHLEVMPCHEGTQPQEVARKLQAAATTGTLISLQGFELMPDVVCTVIAAQLRSLLKVGDWLGQLECLYGWCHHLHMRRAPFWSTSSQTQSMQCKTLATSSNRPSKAQHLPHMAGKNSARLPCKQHMMPESRLRAGSKS